MVLGVKAMSLEHVWTFEAVRRHRKAHCARRRWLEVGWILPNPDFGRLAAGVSCQRAASAEVEMYGLLMGEEGWYEGDGRRVGAVQCTVLGCLRWV